MSEADGDEGAGAGGISLGSSSDSAPKTVEGKSLSTLSAIASGPGWTKVSCSCCMSERVEPLILVKLSEKVRPETKRWLIKLIGTSQKEGGKSCGNVTGPQDQSVFWPRIKHSLSFQLIHHWGHSNFINVLVISRWPFTTIFLRCWIIGPPWRGRHW